MKFLSWGTDGGPDSVVTGYWLIEIKALFSVVLLRFGDGSREAYHSHAFNCVSWVLKGALLETILHSHVHKLHTPSIFPVITNRDTFHKVFSNGTTWVFSIRGPWSKQWKEHLPNGDTVTLESGRKIVSRKKEPK